MVRRFAVLGLVLLGCPKAAPEPAGSDAAASAGGARAEKSQGEDGGALDTRPVAPHRGKESWPVTRDPTPDLGSSDPAREYVGRYVRATRRYGDQSDCARVLESIAKPPLRTVTVKDCAGKVVRDVFRVDVDGDRLALDDPDAGGPLGTWPDGSDPGGAPSPVRSMEDNRDAPAISEALKAMQLTIVRVQLYGRGTYRIITLAGWRDPIQAKSSAHELQPVIAKVCAASKGEPLALFAGVNRRDLLRIRCPNEARWDNL